MVERLELLHMDRHPVTAELPVETQFRLRHTERVALGSPYPEVVDRVKRLVQREPLTGRAHVIVDATGVGAPVVDLLKEARLASALEDLAQLHLEEGRPLPVPSKEAHSPEADLIELVPLSIHAGTVSR